MHYVRPYDRFQATLHDYLLDSILGQDNKYIHISLKKKCSYHAGVENTDDTQYRRDDMNVDASHCNQYTNTSILFSRKFHLFCIYYYNYYNIPWLKANAGTYTTIGRKQNYDGGQQNQ